jgi:serine/threonine-protein kinase
MRLVWPNGHAREWQVSRGGSTAIDFAGSFDAFRHVVPMIEVLRWYRDGDSLRLRAVFRGRAVLVGTASRTEAPGDLGPTPLSPVTPMIFVHANVLDNLYRGHVLRTVPSGVYVPAMGVVGAGLGAAGVVLSLPAAAVVLLVGGLLIALVGQAALVSSALSIPLSLALLLPVTVLAAAAGLRYSDALRNVPRPLAANPRDDVDRRFGDYVLKEFVAHGGMGLVYRAWSRSRKGHVAIKLMRDAYRAKPEDLRRFRRETEALRRLRHPNIAALLEHGHSAGIEYIAMEFVQGVPLARLVERGPIEQRRALEIGVMICSALVEAHGRGIIHRDIKPSNVMVQEDGVAKLLDFGLAQILDPGGAEGLDATARWNRSGTGPYIAPEIFLLHPYDHRIDIYGVGQLLFEMLTGRRPFQETDPGDLMSQVTGEPPPRPRVLNASIRPEIEYIVLRCLAKWPDERFQTAGELLQRLQSSAGWFPR